MGIIATCPCNFLEPSVPISPILYTPFPLDDGVLQCMTHFTTYWIRQHPVHDGGLRLPSNLVGFAQAFAIH